MDKYIKSFIEQNIDLIENNEWIKIYNKLLSDEYYAHLIIHGLFDMAEFNTLLLDSGINPLDYLTYVPERFLWGSDFTKITLPQHIKSIGDRAFYNCWDLKDINLDNVEAIWDRAFSEDRDLDTIKLKDFVRLGRYSFSNSHIHNLYAPTHLNHKCDLSAFDECIIDNLYYEETEQVYEGLNIESIFRDSKIGNIIFKI